VKTGRHVAKRGKTRRSAAKRGEARQNDGPALDVQAPTATFIGGVARKA
jgi:hypothetical protein